MRLRRFGAATRDESGPQSRVTAVVLLQLQGQPGRSRRREMC
jgi:hypothetical protein